ncbi:MAG: TlpA disulfide reductase family protein [Hyphomonadaceae bacterium]|nr:TlpA disulfide reductase family protein [Hyphomonadaceae bacterium]
MAEINLTLIAQGRAHAVPANLEDGAYRIDPKYVDEVLGWKLKPEGLCRAGLCIPAKPGLITEAGLDVARFADLVGAPMAVDSGANIVAIAAPVEVRLAEQANGEAPDFELPDLAGATTRLSDYRGRKVLLVTWASWCGCRDDLPRWRELHDELSPDGLTIITVAQESSIEDARPFIERAEPTHPSLIDLNHQVSEAYGFINVPTVVWIDEAGKIARAPKVEHASNMYAFAHKLDCEPHLAALRRWVKEGVRDMSTSDIEAQTLTATWDDQMARAEFALGWHLHQIGRADAAKARFERAEQLAPLDWTIRRGTMRLREQDPFGVDFARAWTEWEEMGRPDYAALAAERR